MCVQHRLIGLPSGDQILVLLHYAKVGIDVSRYENCSVPGDKEKNENVSKITTFLETTGFSYICEGSKNPLLETGSMLLFWQ